MPRISLRGDLMPESPIRKLVPYAEDAVKKGIKVFHLNIGQPDIRTPEVALAAIKNIGFDVIEYSHSAGILSLRDKMVQFYKSYGINIDNNQILVTTGGSEAILFALMSCCDVGDEVIVPEPFYANYNGFASSAGVNVVPITSYIEDGFAMPPIEEFEKKITSKTRAILLSNPNNPTGGLYTKADLNKLKEIVLKYNLYLLSDEVYRDFCYTSEPYFSVMELEGMEKHAILIDSVSKRYSSCGTRIGFLVTRNTDIIKTSLKFAQARLSPPTFGQIAAEACLETPKAYFEQVYKEYLERRDFLVESLNKIPGVYCPKPNGAFYVIARLPVDDSDKFAQWLLSDFSYNNQTVMVAPASGFYASKGLGHDEVRIAYVLNVKKLRICMEILSEAIRIYPGKKVV
jgi:aspartate aminotransferase